MKQPSWLAALGLFGALAAPAAAQDVASGEMQFSRQCVACHVVKSPDGETLAGRNARTGPNLYGLEGRALGSVDGFRYGDAIQKLGLDGVVWNEERFVAYVQDPTAWLRGQLGDRRARGKMAYQVRDPQVAADLYAYLKSLAPAAQ